MTNLNDILKGVKFTSTSDVGQINVQGIRFDSRMVENGDLFVAIVGTQVDGHEYITDELVARASAVVVNSGFSKELSIPVVKVEDTSVALGLMASQYYDEPTKKIKLIGITGTNGKTSVATMLYNLFSSFGVKCGLVSTVENIIAGEVTPTRHTTPDPLKLNKLFKEMVDKGCDYAFMEVSSHAVHQNRIKGLDFDVAVFTNISHDHLDYHGTFDEYIKAKKKFFDELKPSAYALVNIDDRRAEVMVQNTKALVKSFGLRKMADYKTRVISNTIQGLELEINKIPVWIRLVGEFNAYNILAVYAVAKILDFQSEELLAKLSMIAPANGRFECVRSKEGVLAVIDYAHTPDALKNVLETITEVKGKEAKVVSVVGCGGNRDRVKRPLMAKLAQTNSNITIITSDNPRDEEPGDIIEEMMNGIDKTSSNKVLKIVDREEAIKTACVLSGAGDIILIAGKGHETYQEIKGVRYHFDDKEIVEKTFES